MNIFFKYFFVILILNSYFLKAVDEIFLLSVPKSGSHLIQKCLSLINKEFGITSAQVPISHAGFNPENVEYLQNLSKKYQYLFLNIRDPRDQIISFIHHVFGPKILNQEPVGYVKHYSVNSRNLSFDEILLCSICFGSAWYQYFHRQCNNKVDCNGILNFYKPYLICLNNPAYNFCSIKFENLVGPKGGGSLDLQYAEISKICNHLKLNPTPENIKNIADNLFGDTRTFRDGQIGSWKKHFKQVHKICFKEIAGQLLIDLGYEKDLNW